MDRCIPPGQPFFFPSFYRGANDCTEVIMAKSNSLFPVSNWDPRITSENSFHQLVDMEMQRIGMTGYAKWGTIASSGHEIITPCSLLQSKM